MNKNLTLQNSTFQFLIYKSDNQDIKVDVLLYDENIWLTQEQMAQLFGKAKSTINEHDNAYKMLSDSQKSKHTVEEFKKFATEDPVDENPKPSNFQEEQMPYKKVAIQFAAFLVNKEYQSAHGMLTKELQKEYASELLQKEMIDMTDYFEDPNSIWVDIEFVEESGALDDRWIYVPICEDGNSEAVTVQVFLENNKERISSIEWRRP